MSLKDNIKQVRNFLPVIREDLRCPIYNIIESLERYEKALKDIVKYCGDDDMCILEECQIARKALKK